MILYAADDGLTSTMGTIEDIITVTILDEDGAKSSTTIVLDVGIGDPLEAIPTSHILTMAPV
jgi:hypothetical protein